MPIKKLVKKERKRKESTRLAKFDIMFFRLNVFMSPQPRIRKPLSIKKRDKFSNSRNIVHGGYIFATLIFSQLN